MVVGAAARRYEALDALRGICALLVALFHLKSAGYLAQLALVRNAWLFVDFFFVLSGFVIAASYGDKLREGFSIARFMALRLGRVYPLHLFMLGIYAAFETVKLLLGDSGLVRNPAWQSPNGPVELFHSITLTQIFGFTPSVSWNAPSWSIAAEVWTYLLMAFMLAWGGKRAGMVIAAIGLGSAVALLAIGHPFLNQTFAWALLRCAYGFSLGMLVFWWTRSRGDWAEGGWATAIEWGTIIAAGAFVALIPAEGPGGLLAPLVFALAVLVFAYERGGASRLLNRPWPLLLGTLSYSIYMIHLFVEARAVDVALMVANRTGLPVASIGPDAAGRQVKMLGSAQMPWTGDLMTLASLLAIIALSWLTYRFVEQPCRAFTRRRVLSGNQGATGAIEPIAADGTRS